MAALLFRGILIAMAAEFAVMLLLFGIDGTQEIRIAVLDSLLMTALAMPFLYCFVARAAARRFAARLERLRNTAACLNELLSRALLSPTDPDLPQVALDAVTGAMEVRYGALGLLDPAGQYEAFLTAGISPEAAKEIGSLPTGRGLLAVMTREDRALRLEDMTKDARAVGFPPGHPPMKTLLGVRIGHRGKALGRLYVSERLDGRPFTEEDEVAAFSFANALGVILAHRGEAARRREAEVAAKAAKRAKRTFLTHMSHELRTPMNGLLGLTELLLETELDQEQREYAQAARSSSQSLFQTLDAILELSSLDKNQYERQQAEYEVGGLVRKAVESFQRRASEKGLKLECDIDPSVPVTTRGYSRDVRKVLEGLLWNVITFSESGRIAVRVSTEPAAGAEARLRFEVRDAGIGIPPQAGGRVFEPFFQVDSSSTRKFPGPGLGLALCRQFVLLMDGTIDYESSPGVGSTFWFSVPLIGLPEAAPADPDGNGSAAAGSAPDRLVLNAGASSLDREPATLASRCEKD